MDPVEDVEWRIRAVAALDQPTRRDLYRLLADRDDWVTRDQASEAIGLARSVAAFHLDKLADAGIVDVSYERTTGRSGPGAGRPSKRYRRAEGEVAASVPERHYDLAGSLLASAVVEATRTGAPVEHCLSTAARGAGRAAGEQASAATGPPAAGGDRRRAVLDVLTRHGYEPCVEERGEVALVNCPFHRLAEEHRSLVCGMNLEFLAGVLEGIGQGGDLEARLAPAPGACCVRIGGLDPISK